MAGAPKGNKNGSKGKPWADAINRALARTSIEGRNALDRIADKLIAKAENDLDQFAITELVSRTDGKAVQAVELSGSIETNSPEELSDADLARIATTSSTGITEQAGSAQTTH